MIWVGTWIGLMVRAPDAVMGVGFVVVFPLTFLTSAFVPIDTLPPVLQHIAAWNPISVMVGAVRVMFGNPTVPVGCLAGRSSTRCRPRSSTASSCWRWPSPRRCAAIAAAPATDGDGIGTTVT